MPEGRLRTVLAAPGRAMPALVPVMPLVRSALLLAALALSTAPLSTVPLSIVPLSSLAVTTLLAPAAGVCIVLGRLRRPRNVPPRPVRAAALAARSPDLVELGLPCRPLGRLLTLRIGCRCPNGFAWGGVNRLARLQRRLVGHRLARAVRHVCAFTLRGCRWRCVGGSRLLDGSGTLGRRRFGRCRCRLLLGRRQRHPLEPEAQLVQDLAHVGGGAAEDRHHVRRHPEAPIACRTLGSRI